MIHPLQKQGIAPFLQTDIVIGRGKSTRLSIQHQPSISMDRELIHLAVIGQQRKAREINGAHSPPYPSGGPDRIGLP